ncbi:MAG: hypothetical protein PVF34_02275 [Gammaproteobacteria bacterium]
MVNGHQARMMARILVVYIALLSVVWSIEDAYGTLLLPLYQWVIELVQPTLNVQDIFLKENNGQTLFHFFVETASPVLVGDQILPVGFRLSASTLAGHASQHVLIILCIAAGWPASRWLEYSIRAVAVILMLIFVECVDIPMVIAGSIWDLLLANLAPGELPSNFLVNWMHLMNGGGRIAVSIAAALLAVSFSRYIVVVFGGGNCSSGTIQNVNCSPQQ